MGGSPVDAEGASHFVAEHDVLTDGEVGAEVYLLIHGGDASILGVCGAVEFEFCGAHGDASGVNPVHAGEGFDEGGLAGSVFPHERVYFSGE